MGIDAMIIATMLTYLEGKPEAIELNLLTKVISKYLNRPVTVEQVVKAVKRNKHRLKIEKRRDGHYYVSFKI